MSSSALRPILAELAIDQIRRHAFRLLESGSDQPVIGRQGADRIGAAGVARQQEGLAAAAAPVDLAPLATLARLGHPVGAPEAVEGVGAVPDIGKAAVWLSSDDSDYVNGTTLFVDGGMTLYPGFEDNG